MSMGAGELHPIQTSRFPQLPTLVITDSEEFRATKSKWDPILAKFENALAEASSEGKTAALLKHSSRQLLGEIRLMRTILHLTDCNFELATEWPSYSTPRLHFSKSATSRAMDLKTLHLARV